MLFFPHLQCWFASPFRRVSSFCTSPTVSASHFYTQWGFLSCPSKALFHEAFSIPKPSSWIHDPVSFYHCVHLFHSNFIGHLLEVIKKTSAFFFSRSPTHPFVFVFCQLSGSRLLSSFLPHCLSNLRIGFVFSGTKVDVSFRVLLSSPLSVASRIPHFVDSIKEPIK